MEPKYKQGIIDFLEDYSMGVFQKAFLKKDDCFIDVDGTIRIVVATGGVQGSAGRATLYMLAYDDGTIESTDNTTTSVPVIRVK